MDKKERLVLRVNELHHDYIDKFYNSQNQKMFNVERANWIQEIKKLNFKDKKILEIGTGSGFLPITFLEAKLDFKLFVCTDISKNILREARENIKKKSNKKLNSFRFVKLDGIKLPFKDNSFDFIVLNSVLHHLPNIPLFYKEASRVLKKDGFLIIGHEPNYYFYNSYFSLPYKMISKIVGLMGRVRERLKNKNETDPMVEYVNKFLLQEKLIKKSLSKKEISKLVDYHAAKGIIFDKKPRFLKIVRYKTYLYLGTLSFNYNYKFIKPIFNFIELSLSILDYRKKFGSNYFIIYKNEK